MSLHLFVIDKAGTCSTLGAFVDRHEARPVFAKSGAVAGIYTLDSGVVLSTLAEPSEGQLRRLKEFALATLAGSAPAVPPPPAPEPAPRRAKPLRSVAARAADLDDENERLRRAPSRIERVAVERRIGLAEAAHVVAAEEIEPARPRIFEPLGIIRDDDGELDARASAAATEPPHVEAPLPVAFDAPVVASDLSAEIESLRVQLTDATARAAAAEEATAQMQAVLDGVRANADALDNRVAHLQVALAAAVARADASDGREAVLAASLREQSREIATRDRTIAKLRAELAAKSHPVVRVAAPARRRPAPAATETPVGTLFRVIRERARGAR